MGLSGEPEPGSENVPLLQDPETQKVPEDKFGFAYIIHFVLGLGFLLPWNTFVTAVDYFSTIYPGVSVNRIFAAVYMPTQFVGLFVIVVFFAHKTRAHARINLGLGLFVASLVAVPLIDWVYVKGRVGLYSGFYLTAGALGVAGVADALAQGSVVGAAGELPERYMQAIVAGISASGVLVSFLRILTKAVFSQDSDGLRKSASLYFAITIVVMLVCVVFYNIGRTLPVIKYYEELKIRAVRTERETKDPYSTTGSIWKKTLFQITTKIKWHLTGIILIFVVSFSIYPGSITDRMRSESLKDWFPILVISLYCISDLVGKLLIGVFLLRNEKIAVCCCVGRLLFYPLFWICLNGLVQFPISEIPILVLTCLLAITNGYFSGILIIMAPKSVSLEHAEAAGIVVVLFLVFGLAVGSVLAWFWVI